MNIVIQKQYTSINFIIKEKKYIVKVFKQKVCFFSFINLSMIYYNEYILSCNFKHKIL
jgi:hypothetical protein